MLIPIGTEVRTRRPPRANHALIIANALIFLLTDVLQFPIFREIKPLFMLDGAWPSPYQYITYQFLHGDSMHLIGNMLFLWIFGNAVCDRLGWRVYLMFYLAGGVFSGIVFTYVAENPIMGASGSIAAVTTAFLVLYPRVHITMLLYALMFLTFQIPAMYLIVFKIILWDNVLAPSISAGVVSNVAYSAHLGGYAFGAITALTMLLIRAAPRSQFDLLALWDRWNRRSGFVPIRRGGQPDRRTIEAAELESHPLHTLPLSESEKLREAVLDQMELGRSGEACAAYQHMIEHDPSLVLPRRQQLEIANLLNQGQDFPWLRRRMRVISKPIRVPQMAHRCGCCWDSCTIAT
jgi:membrane associated rhomboid family serine protease